MEIMIARLVCPVRVGVGMAARGKARKGAEGRAETRGGVEGRGRRRVSSGLAKAR